MPNDDFPLDQFQRIAMTLSEILANRPQNRALARASDVPGADLQWMYTTAYPTGAWYGDLGELGTTAFRDALFTGYLALGVTCKVSGVSYSWGGAGVGWLPMGINVSSTLAELLAITGLAGSTAKCTDPMFGPMGAAFDWAQSLGKWVPRNARIYGSGVGTIYTASAGDINTDVQVGSLTIPATLLYPGIDVMCVSVGERSSGVGTIQHKILCGAAPIGAAQVGYALTQSGRLLASGGVGINGNLTQKGPFNGGASGGGGGGTSYVWAGAGASCLVKATLNAPTAGMVQTLTELYAELSYGG